MAARAASTNPQLAQAAKAMSGDAALSHFALLAVRSGGAGTGRAQNLQVVVGSSEGATLDVVSGVIKQQLAAEGATAIQEEDTQVNGRNGFKLTYEITVKGATGAGVQIPITQYVAIHDDVLAAITVTFPGDGKDAQAIADSFLFS